MKRIFLILTLLTSTIVTNLFAQCNVAGWASTNGVTGGGTAAPTVVTTYAELRTAVNSTAVKVIHVSGQITFPSAGRLTLNNQTNKSILGLAGARLISTDLTAGGSGILTLKTVPTF